MDYIALFLIVILATTKTTPLHHHCNSDVFSSASGLQELTILQYCLIDNCTIIRNDTRQLDIVYTTQSHLIVTPTDGQTSTLLISKNDPELFCSSPSTTDDNNILIAGGAVTLLLSSLFSGYTAVLLLLFKSYAQPLVS